MTLTLDIKQLKPLIPHGAIKRIHEKHNWHRNTIAKVLNGELVNIEIMACLIEEAKKTIKVNQEIETLLHNINSHH